MCKAFVLLYFPLFAFCNGFALPIVLVDNIFCSNLMAIDLGEVWVFLVFLQLVNSIYGLIMVCGKSELKCIIIPWACQSVCINIFFFFWTIVFSQDNSGSFEATEAITFAFLEAFSIYTLYVVFKYYCEFVEEITLRHFCVCLA